jgi:hypothetical protein
MMLKKNYKNFIQMYLILNNKVLGQPTCLGIHNLNCKNCLFTRPNSCYLFIDGKSLIEFLQQNLSIYSLAEQLIYLIQGGFNGTNT